jgi:hypothetical protein
MTVSSSPVAKIVTPAKATRKSYTLKEKRNTIRTIDVWITANKKQSVREACGQLGIHHSLYARWKKEIAKAALLQQSPEWLPNIVGTMRKIHAGRKGILAPIKSQLERFVFELRERGMNVSTTLVYA